MTRKLANAISARESFQLLAYRIADLRSRTSFHPLTCRKHHCRLCGRIICALPIKNPQRKALCSILFVVDKQSRQVEEVGEGVDYGVRKRKPSTIGGEAKMAAEEEKFLKGVRICRDCRPILL